MVAPLSGVAATPGESVIESETVEKHRGVEVW